MATEGGTGNFRLTVLNPGGRDAYQDFSAGAGVPNESKHAPVNFHGYAACTRGVFHRDAKDAAAEGLPVLLLLRSDFKDTQDALAKLKERGLTVVVSLKETGLHQIAAQLGDPRRAALFREIVTGANGCLATTPEALRVYETGRFIPTPYPIDDPLWDFSRRWEERAGIFVGTREWDVPSRNHFTALVLALEISRETGETVTVFEEDPRRCQKLVAALGFAEDALRLITRRLAYADYLDHMARHKIVFQADKSSVPGQVAGDALLCRMPCVGGDGAIDRLAFPHTCGYGRSLGELIELATRLLRDPQFYSETVAQSQAQAREKVGFDAVAPQLAQFFGSLVR